MAMDKSREERLHDLVANGNPLALMLSEQGRWHVSTHTNEDKIREVLEFDWPTSAGALAAIKELGLET